MFSAVCVTTILIFVILVGICPILFQFVRQRRFRRRPIIPFSDWLGSYYGDIEPECIRHLERMVALFSDEIGVAPTQLLPTDDVHNDYLPGGVFRMCDVSWDYWCTVLAQYVSQVTNEPLTDAECELVFGWASLDDFLRGVVELIELRMRRQTDVGEQED